MKMKRLETIMLAILSKIIARKKGNLLRGIEVCKRDTFIKSRALVWIKKMKDSINHFFLGLHQLQETSQHLLTSVLIHKL